MMLFLDVKLNFFEVNLRTCTVVVKTVLKAETVLSSHRFVGYFVFSRDILKVMEKSELTLKRK